MARYPTIDIATVSLTVPNFLALQNAIEDLDDAEGRFYRSRRDELNGYPGQSARTPAQIESAYDALLGTSPWTYISQLNSSGNSLKSPSGTPYYVRMPSVLSDLGTDFEDSNGNTYVLYQRAGLRSIDLLFTDIAFFDIGSSGIVDDGFNDDPTSINYQTGFGEIPVAYQSNSQLSGRVAHTLYVAGTTWNSIVGDAYDEYKEQLDIYEESSGGGDFDFYKEGASDRPWENYKPSSTNFGYNRPESLSIKLVEEARGYN